MTTGCLRCCAPTSSPIHDGYCASCWFAGWRRTEQPSVGVGLAPALRAVLSRYLGGEPGAVQYRDRASLFLVVDLAHLMALDPQWVEVLAEIDQREAEKAARKLTATRDEIQTAWKNGRTVPVGGHDE